MWIKLIGSGFLIIAGIAAAISVRAYYRRRMDTLDGFISLIFYIKGQVDCYARPIGDILMSLPTEILRACNCPKGASTLDEMIDESKIYLDRESFRLILLFSSEFGSLFREEQTRRCDHYISMLNQIREGIYGKTEGEMRSGGAICICLSLCLAILLW